MMDLPVEIYDRVENNGETYIVIQVLPGRLAICVREVDIGGGALVVSTYLIQLSA
jgi:hypothetical protein